MKILTGECRDSALKLGYDHFLPNSSQFIIFHLSPYHRSYIVLLLKKRTKINSQSATFDGRQFAPEFSQRRLKRKSLSGVFMPKK
jgi:hypothetical protein